MKKEETGLGAAFLRRMIAALAALLAVQWSVDAFGRTAAFPVPLEVRETSGTLRIREPVASGVPIAREAQILDVASLRLVDDAGDPVPAQLTVLARWDGAPSDTTRPVRWVLVEFQATLGAGETRTYRLEEGPAPDPGPDMTVTQDAQSVSVDTGNTVFRIRTDRFNFLDHVQRDLDDDGIAETTVVPADHQGGVKITQVGKSPYSSSDDGAPTVQVVLEGPLRTVIRVAGELDSDSDNDRVAGQLSHFEYTAYYSFYRDHDFARVRFSVRYPERNKEFDQHAGGRDLYHEFESMNLEFPALLDDDRTFRIHGDAPVDGSLAAGESARIYQDSSGGDAWAPPPGDEDHPWFATTFRGYRVYRGAGPVPDDVLSQGDRAPGYGVVHDGTRGVLVGMRHFWQNYPKGIRLQHNGGIVIELFPADWRTSHRFRGGVQKTHELLVGFPAAAPESDEVASVVAGFEDPLFAVAPAEVYRDSMALGRIATEDAELFEHYDDAAEAVVDYQGEVFTQGDIYDEREDDDLYGWMNFGDSYRGGSKSSGTRYFGNNELDFSYCLLVAYLRDAEHDPRFLQNGLAIARHLYDIDQYHTERDLYWANLGIRKHDANGVQDHSRGPNLSHHWVQGMKLYYWLTGDPLARTFLQNAAAWLTSLEQPAGSGEIQFSGEIRSKGWLLQSFVDLYEATGDEALLDLSERMIPEIILDVLTPGGYIVNSKVEVDPWQLSYITEGFGRYLLQMRSLGRDDPGGEEALTRILGFLEHEAWIPESGQMCYTWDPIEEVPLDTSFNVSQTSADGFVYGYLVTGRVSYLDMARLCYDSIHSGGDYPYYYSETLLTPAKSAAFRLRFGHAQMWLRQTVHEDTRAPAVIDLAATEVEPDSVIAVLETDEQTARLLFVWAEGEPMTLRKNFHTYLHTHPVYVGGLEPETEYSMAAIAVDLAGNQSWSEVVTFETPPAQLLPRSGRSIEGGEDD